MQAFWHRCSHCNCICPRKTQPARYEPALVVLTAPAQLLPTAFSSLNDPCLPDLFTDDYPALPGVIMMGSLFVLFVIEMWLNAKTGGHSHGGPTGETIVHEHAHPQNPVPPAYPYGMTQKPNSMVTEYPLE